jgi:hypothetical protein
MSENGVIKSKKIAVQALNGERKSVRLSMPINRKIKNESTVSESVAMQVGD